MTRAGCLCGKSDDQQRQNDQCDPDIKTISLLPERVTDEESSRLAFRDLAVRMGLRIGLWFGPAIKGRKRVVRRLLGGVTKFGDDELPVPLFGAQ